MKNFKKVIILSIAVLVILSYLIYDYLSNNSNEAVEEDIFVETSEEILETNTIILHITGEVNAPRNYRN